MKRGIIFLCLFIDFFFIVKAQNEYAAIDDKMKNIPQSSTKTTAGIADYINANFSTQSEKSRAVYIWVTENIRYDIENMFKPVYYKDKQELIDKVLKTRKGICMHYALLFSSIANQVGIKSYVIEGYTKQNGKIDKTPHSWSAAQIDSTWYLFDPTWGSGYAQKEKFVRKINNLFYKVEPEILIKSHMPFDPMWQLSNYPINNQEFYDSKFNNQKDKAFFNFQDSIKVYAQQSEIERLESSTKRIEKNGVKNSFISDKLKQNKSEIDFYYQIIDIDKFNLAIDAYNKASNNLTTFIEYRNKQFTPRKTDEEIKMMLDSTESLLNTSEQQLKEIKNAKPDMLKAMKQLEKSLNETTLKLNEQKVFLEKYFISN